MFVFFDQKDYNTLSTASAGCHQPCAFLTITSDSFVRDLYCLLNQILRRSMAVPPPPDLNRNTFIFRPDSSKQRRGLFSGKTQSGVSPHSQAQGSNNRASIPTPAVTLPSPKTVGLGAAAGNYWGNEVPLSQIQILPQEVLYAGPVRPDPMMYASHKRGFWAKISDWWDGEPCEENVS